jgi:hypothetical protein
VKRVSPTTETPTGPTAPKPYMDTTKFDKKN